jgi:hypothetical protein
MKKIFLFLISIFATASAFAEPFSFSNFYIDGFGGINFVNSFKERGVRVDLNSGYAVGGALGYRFSRFFRLEGEAAYRSNTFDQVVVKDMQFPASGGIKNMTAMANGLIEIPLLENTLIPYFGGGIGESWSRENFKLEPIATDEGTYVFDRSIKSSRGLAGQGIVGLIFSTGQKIQAAVEYRYLDGSHIQGNHTIGLNLKRYF